MLGLFIYPTIDGSGYFFCIRRTWFRFELIDAASGDLPEILQSVSDNIYGDVFTVPEAYVGKVGAKIIESSGFFQKNVKI